MNWIWCRKTVLASFDFENKTRKRKKETNSRFETKCETKWKKAAKKKEGDFFHISIQIYEQSIKWCFDEKNIKKSGQVRFTREVQSSFVAITPQNVTTFGAKCDINLKCNSFWRKM